MSPKMYRQRIYNMGIEDMEINVSSLENSMRTLRTINDMGKVLKKIRHNLRIDIRIMRMDYIKKIQNINELADKKGFFGKKNVR